MANILQFIINFSSRGASAVMKSVSGLQQRINAADRSAGRLASSVGGRLRDAFMSLPGAQFFTNPIVALSAGIGVVSRLGMQAETTATSFKVLLGSQEASAEMLDRINEYAKYSPYDRLGAQNAVKTMLGFGVAAESVVSDLKLLGDVAGGDNQRLQQLALVFGQISAAGKLQGQDLLQLINAGYNPLLDMSEMTGKSMSQLRDEMSKGMISMDMVRAAFVRATSEGGRFYGMIDEIAGSGSGKLGEMKDTALEALLAVYDVIRPLVIPALELATKVLNAVVPAVNAVARAVQWLVNLFKEGNPVIIGITALMGSWTAAVVLNTTVLKGWRIAQLASYYASLLMEKGVRLLNLALKANPIGIIISLVVALGAALAACWKKFAGFRAVIKTAWDTLRQFGTILKDLVISRITSLLQGIGKVGQAIGRLFKGDFSGAWETAKDAGRLLANTDGARKAAQSVRGIDIAGNYRSRLDSEREKQRAKEAISADPSAAGAAPMTEAAGIPGTPAASAAPSATQTADQIATGGTRNTSINVTISKFFDDVNVTMPSGGVSLAELQQAVVESLNRSLEIALSAAR